MGFPQGQSHHSPPPHHRKPAQRCPCLAQTFPGTEGHVQRDPARLWTGCGELLGMCKSCCGFGQPGGTGARRQPRERPPGTRRRKPRGPGGAAGRDSGPPPPDGSFASASRRPNCAGSPGGGRSGPARKRAVASAVCTCPGAAPRCGSPASPIALSAPEQSRVGSARGWHRATGGGMAFGGLSENKGNPWAERRSQNHQTCARPGWHLVGWHQRGLAAPTELTLPRGGIALVSRDRCAPPKPPTAPLSQQGPQPITTHTSGGDKCPSSGAGEMGFFLL